MFLKFSFVSFLVFLYGRLANGQVANCRERIRHNFDIILFICSIYIPKICDVRYDNILVFSFIAFLSFEVLGL